ncbi:TNF receptor-associated factor 4-like [Oculina patagonica]
MAEAKKAERRNWPPSGYDEDFVNAVEEDCQCLICHLPLKEPVLTRCGHRFCKECLEVYFRRQEVYHQPYNCPMERKDLDRDRDVFPDKATERKVLSFDVRCPIKGCHWTGELRNKEDHITKCGKVQVNCPNGCCGSFPREMIPSHTQNECPLELVSCPYVQMGCKRKVQRQDVDCHLESEMKPHLDLACVKLQNTEVKLNETEVKLNDAQKELATTRKLVDTRTFIWKIDDFSDILSQAKTLKESCIESPPFYTDKTESYGYKLKVKVYPNGVEPYKNTHLSVYIVGMKGEYDAILPWPFKKRVKISLIDQQEDSAKRENISRQFVADYFPDSFARPGKEDNSGLGYSSFVSHEKLYSRRYMYLVDDTVFLQVEIGPSRSEL